VKILSPSECLSQEAKLVTPVFPKHLEGLSDSGNLFPLADAIPDMVSVSNHWYALLFQWRELE
jgi:hypothetical protein